MIVATTYKDGVSIQLYCDPDMDRKTVTFGVNIFTSSYSKPLVPVENVGSYTFDTWPEAVDFFNANHKKIMTSSAKEDSYGSKV